MSVTPLSSRYGGEIGDVVIGRIQEVGFKKWIVDINSRHEAVLLLSAVNLPGMAYFLLVIITFMSPVLGIF